MPELLEIAAHAACLWALLEERGIAHGDIRVPIVFCVAKKRWALVAPSNVFISDHGDVFLIDFDNFACRR